MPVQMQHGVYSFYFECLNSSWWEIEYYDGFLHDDFFDFGDRYTDSVLERETTPGSRSEEHTSELQSLMRISYAVFCLQKKTQLHPTPKQMLNKLNKYNN